MLQAWAEFHSLRFVVELDNQIEGDEYEEVIALYREGNLLRRWTVWRVIDTIVIEPMNGHALRFTTISDALQQMIPAHG